MNQEYIKVNQVLTLKCIGKGQKGDGIFKTEDRFTIIVPETIADKTYEIKITRVLDTVAFGEVVQEIIDG